MSNPWDNLTEELLGIIKSSVTDLVDTERPEVEAFLKENAVQAAKQTWISLNGSDSDKAEAISNLRHLKSQAVMRAVSLQIIATTAAVNLLSKVMEVVVNFSLTFGRKLLLGV